MLYETMSVFNHCSKSQSTVECAAPSRCSDFCSKIRWSCCLQIGRRLSFLLVFLSDSPLPLGLFLYNEILNLICCCKLQLPCEDLLSPVLVYFALFSWFISRLIFKWLQCVPSESFEWDFVALACPSIKCDSGLSILDLLMLYLLYG